MCRAQPWAPISLKLLCLTAMSTLWSWVLAMKRWDSGLTRLLSHSCRRLSSHRPYYCAVHGGISYRVHGWESHGCAGKCTGAQSGMCALTLPSSAPNLGPCLWTSENKGYVLMEPERHLLSAALEKIRWRFKMLVWGVACGFFLNCTNSNMCNNF